MKRLRLIRSARMGNKWAMRLLGFCYKNAPGEMGGIAASIEWFRRAAERGDKAGQVNSLNCMRTVKAL